MLRQVLFFGKLVLEIKKLGLQFVNKSFLLVQVLGKLNCIAVETGISAVICQNNNGCASIHQYTHVPYLSISSSDKPAACTA